MRAALRIKGVVKPQQRPTIRKERTYAIGDGAGAGSEDSGEPMAGILEDWTRSGMLKLRCISQLDFLMDL